MNYQPLKGVTDIYQYTLSNEIQDGLVEYFDWALMDIGNYYNVTLGELSPSSQDYSRLSYSKSEEHSAGEVWEGFRKNWVWQSGVDHSPSPLVGNDNANPGISGVYVDDIFYPSDTTGDYSHYVDYYNGRVVFDSPIPTGSKVQAEFSYKWVNVTYAQELPWIREIQVDSNRPTSYFTNRKGDWSLDSDQRLQLPAIAVEIVPVRNFKPYQFGGGQWVYSDVIFHCLAEDEQTRNKLIDIVSFQNDKIIYLLNTNQIYTNSDNPLDYRGTPVSGAMEYPELVQSYPGGKLMLKNATVQEIETIDSDLFAGLVRFTTEGIKTTL